MYGKQSFPSGQGIGMTVGLALAMVALALYISAAVLATRYELRCGSACQMLVAGQGY